MAISKIRGEQVWDNLLDVAVFSGVGNLAGRIVNTISKWTSKPSIFSKAEAIDLKSVTLCCTLFVTIDRLAHYILRALFGDEQANKPIHSAIRIGIDTFASIQLFNLLSSTIQASKIELKSAATVIITAVILYTFIIDRIRTFDTRK